MKQRNPVFEPVIYDVSRIFSGTCTAAELLAGRLERDPAVKTAFDARSACLL